MMIVSSYVWMTLGIIAGIVILYFFCLKLADNDWVGSRPPGPRHLPFTRCGLHYLSSWNFPSKISQLFLKYGDIFALSFFSQKVVYIENKERLSDSIKKKDVKVKTMQNFAAILSRFGFKSLSEEEILFLERVWSEFEKWHKDQGRNGSDESWTSSASQKFERNLATLVNKLQTEDFRQSVTSGELLSAPATLTLSGSQTLNNDIKTSRSSDRLTIDGEGGTGVDVMNPGNEYDSDLQHILLLAHQISEILMSRPHVWWSTMLYRLPSNYIQRKRMAGYLSDIRTCLQKFLLSHGLRSEISYLTLLVLIYVQHEFKETQPVPSSSTRSKEARACDRRNGREEEFTTGVDYGPNLVGYRSYLTMDYIAIDSYTIPKYTIIISKF